MNTLPMATRPAPNPDPVLREPETDRPQSPETYRLVGKHVPALDGLRGLAILPVVAYHFADQFHTYASHPVDHLGLRILQTGWIGVDLFFVLSGFLITGILLDTRTATHYYPTFYGRRFLRIFPAYYVTLLGFFVLIPLLSSHLPTAFRDISQRMNDQQLWFWCYGANWLFAREGAFGTIPGGYLWSLAVEEQFYIVWPVLVLCLKPDHLRRVIFVLLAAGVALRLGLLAGGASPVTVYTATLTHMDGLLAGSVLACVVRKRRSDKLCLRGLGYCAAASAILLVVLGLHQGHFFLWDFNVAAVGLSLLAVVFSYLLAAALTATPDSALGGLLCNRVLRSFGKYSYAIYLLHVPIGLALEKMVFFPPRHRVLGSMLPSTFVFILVGIAVCWLAGFASWHLLERHFLTLKRFLPVQASN